MSGMSFPTSDTQQQFKNKYEPPIPPPQKKSREETLDHMPQHVKNIKFTIGITDYDRTKGRRIPGGCYFEEETILVVD